VGETPAKPGLQFQRGFFIVPAASCFVNEVGVALSRSSKVWGAKVQTRSGTAEHATLAKYRVYAQASASCLARNPAMRDGLADISLLNGK
jgi:hypothetical protein